MDLEKEFGIDQALAEDGVWVDLGDGAAVLVAALPNPRYERFMEPHQRKYRRMGKEVPESVHEEGAGKFILLGWKGLQLGGVDVEPSEKNRIDMLRKYPGFKRVVLGLALDQANFKKSAEEAEEKNS